MFEYPLNAAMAVCRRDEDVSLWVTTDSDEVEEICKEYNGTFGRIHIHIHRRTEPEELNPEASIMYVVQKCLNPDIFSNGEALEKNNSSTIILMANVPEIQPHEIQEAFQVLDRNEAVEVRSFKSKRGIVLQENGLWGFKTWRMLGDPWGINMSTYVYGILSGHTEIHTQEDFDWVANAMTKRDRIYLKEPVS